MNILVVHDDEQVANQILYFLGKYVPTSRVECFDNIKLATAFAKRHFIDVVFLKASDEEAGDRLMRLVRRRNGAAGLARLSEDGEKKFGADCCIGDDDLKKLSEYISAIKTKTV